MRLPTAPFFNSIKTSLPLEWLTLHLTPVGLGDGGGVDAGGTTASTALEVGGSIQPGGLKTALSLEGADLALHLEGQTNIIETVGETVSAERVDFEANNLVALGILNLLVDEVDLNLTASRGLSSDLGKSSLVGDNDGKHAVLEGVVVEDIGEGGGDNALDTEIEQSPRGVLTGTTTTEVGAGHNEDLGIAVDTLVQDEVGVLGAIGIVTELVESGGAKTGTLDGLEELLGDNGVGVDVGAVERSRDTLEGKELGETSTATTAGGGVSVGLVVGGQIENTVELVLGDGGVVGLGLNIDDGLDLGGNGAGGHVLADVGKFTGNSSNSGHGGGHQVSATLGTLATLEVTVGGTGTALLGGQNVGVHTQAHGATSLTPLESSIGEDLVQTLTLSLLLDQARTGNDHSTLDVRSNLLSTDNLGGGAQILDTRVGARSNEDLVHGNISHGDTRGEAHVLQSTLASKLAGRVLEVSGARNDACDGDDILRGGTPRDGGDDVLAIKENINVVLGVRVRFEGRPVGDGTVPLGAAVLRGKRTPLKVLKGDLIGRDHTSTSTTLNGHVTDRHASLHAELANNRSAELNDGTSTTSSSDNTNNVENNVLAGNTGRELTVDLDTHVLASAGKKGLGCEDVLDLTGSDTESQGAEGTVGGSVGVTADDGGAGKSEPLLGADNVNNTLTLIAHTEVGEAEVLDVLLEGGALQARVGFLDESLGALELFPGGCGNVLYGLDSN